jgi:hypothetical protein
MKQGDDRKGEGGWKAGIKRVANGMERRGRGMKRGRR